MARHTRQAAGGYVYHVMNRGNCRMEIFQKPADFAAFIALLEEARRRIGMRILGYCLMHNHWHLVLWPRDDGDLSKFMAWLSSTHVRRWRAHRSNVGEGHLYQGRFKSFLIERDDHLLTVLRYVEANPLRAGIVRRAEQWPWSSLGGAAAMNGVRVDLTSWPVDRPQNWLEIVNEPVGSDALSTLHTSIARGRPFGAETWVRHLAQRLGLQSTLRDPWRPKATAGRQQSQKGAVSPLTRAAKRRAPAKGR
jgi:REP-associated tyrosine transposase